MGVPREPIPALLFTGLLSSDTTLLDVASRLLAERYGPLCRSSDVVPWVHTDYYAEEMGDRLYRQFILFDRPIDPGLLPDVKLGTNDLEREMAGSAAGTRRRINLDPGYVTEAKVVLATTKDFSHRVYLRDGIYAEVTLVYRERERSFTTLSHTYPDFRSEMTITLMNEARKRLRRNLGRAGA